MPKKIITHSRHACTSSGFVIVPASQWGSSAHSVDILLWRLALSLIKP